MLPRDVDLACCQPLVGRGAELALFDDALARRRFAAIELVGEPGIGKTRLLAELEARGDRRGCLVLSGSASELEGDLPFGVFVDALDEYLQGLEPRRLASSRTAPAPSWPRLPVAVRRAPGASERFRLHRAVRVLLEELARPKPLVLVLDDLHWGDSGSLELFGALLRRPPAPRAAGHRGPPAPAAGAAGGRARARGPRGRSPHRAGRLSAAEARELVGDAAGDLYAESGGNPFYLQQLARVPRRAGSGPAMALGGRRRAARRRRGAGRRARAALR